MSPSSGGSFGSGRLLVAASALACGERWSTYIRSRPTTTASAVVAAITGKLPISGLTTASALAASPPSLGVPLPVSSTSTGMTIASTSGGWTIGPNMLARLMNATASIEPTKKHALNSSPGCDQIRMSSRVPAAVGTAARSNAPQSGTPLVVPKAESSDQEGAPLSGAGASGRSRVAVTGTNRNGPVPGFGDTVGELAHEPVRFLPL
ncbi:hypothetical protein HUO13_04725 [Saccharopolyspora erythraea]|nr:hypothetical protein [Saccharopolyspora erythraea]QUH00203.1 hypothetical protein HUO13_04725 [Saccharopolyspora erythraea]